MKNIPALFALLASAAFVVAQDMPLHEIIKTGETWHAVSQPMPEAATCRYEAKPNDKAVALKGKAELLKLPLTRPSCVAEWHGGDALLVGDAGGKHVWTFRIEKNGELTAGDKHCPLRVRPGETESHVSALCIDGAQRVYAAYKEGIMVYDPTGRPCGLITSPASGTVTRLVFEENRLYAKIGDQVYVRKMLAKK